MSKYPFHYVDGLEISDSLIDIAKKNFRKLNIDKIRLFCSDAATFTDLNQYNYIYMHGLANLPDQLPKQCRHISMKHGLAVFCDPCQTQLDVLNSVRCLAIVLHNTAGLLKSSPKGEGFSPIPRGGQ